MTEQNIKAALFEFTTVDEVVAKYHAKELLPACSYTTPAIPMFGEPCANPAVHQSHTLEHPAIYMAEVQGYKMIGGCAFPIVDNKCVKPQMFDVSTWETWEQAKKLCMIQDNMIAYRGFTQHIKQTLKVINLVGNGSFNYAHWLTEFLPQLVLLKNAGVALHEYKVLVAQQSFQSMIDALLMLGVLNENIIRVPEFSFNEFSGALWVSPVANIVFQRPNALRGGTEILAEANQANFHPEALRITASFYQSNISLASKTNEPELIYISRTAGRNKNQRNVLNEGEIVCMLEKQGFVSIDPSKLTFEEQIKKFSNAKCIVAPSGAALLNMLWAPKGAKIVILMNDSKVANYWYFSNIAFSLGHKLSYVLGKVVNTGNWTDINHADFIINISEIYKALDIDCVEHSFVINENKIKILFIIQNVYLWPSIKTIYKALSESVNVTVKVISSEFIHPSSNKKVELDKVNELLFTEGLNVDPNNENAIFTFKPHLVVLQNPYDDTRHKILSSINLNALGIKSVYVPYGIEMGGGDDNYRFQFNCDVQTNSWRVFLRSNRHKDMYAKYCAVGDSHVVVSGHPKFDNQQDFLTYPVSESLKQKISGRKVVLWTPHFSVGLPASWSTYRIYSQMIMQQVEARADVFFIIRPHPLFFKEMLRQQVWDATGEANFRKLCADKDNLWLDEKADYMESFAASNAIMADVGSFLLEYLPTKKPIMYLHHPEGFGLNDDGDLVDHYYRANLPEDIPPFIDMVAKGQDPMREERIGATDEYLFGLDGKAGQRIADYIVEELSKELNETDWHPNPQSDEALQNKTNYYWKNAPSTLNAPPAFYELKDKAFQEALALLPTVDYGIDLGCGEGRYTLPLSKKCNQLDALDISPKLIHVANKRKEKFNITNVAFIQANYQQMQLSKQPDLISCSELTSSIIDNREFAKLMHAVKANLNQQGFLLLSDQFSLGQDKLIQAPNSLVTKIRSLELFKQFIASLGLHLISEATITESTTHQITSRLFLFSKSTKLEYLEKRSKDYWAKSVNSFLAPQAFYQTKKEVLESIINELPQIETMIDIGCGNGYFTNLFANKVLQIKGYDIAAALIQEAKEVVVKQSISNIEYYQSDIENLPQNEVFTLVSCLGVTNCFVDETGFEKLIQKIVSMINAQGFLLVSDSLSTNKSRIYSRDDGYVSNYRNIERYLSAFLKHGLTLSAERLISQDEKSGLTNRLYLFKYGNKD